MNTGRADASLKSKPHPGSSLGEHARPKPAFLGIDRIVENLSAILTRAGARKVEATVPDRTVRLVVDQKEMDEAFATLGNAVARGAAVTIRGNLVRIKTGEKDEDKGCALLSVSVTGGQAVAPGSRSEGGHSRCFVGRAGGHQEAQRLLEVLDKARGDAVQPLSSRLVLSEGKEDSLWSSRGEGRIFLPLMP